MDEDQIIDYIKEKLNLVVETSEDYICGTESETLYKSVHTLKLFFGEECISEVYLG